MARGHLSSLRSPQHADPFRPDLQPAFISECNLLLFLFVVRPSEADRGYCLPSYSEIESF